MTENEFLSFTIDNWDEEGAKPIPMSLFLTSRLIIQLYYDSDCKFECNPCRDGSIDYAWRTEKARMLINIRNNQGSYEMAYYGDCYSDTNKVRGVITLGEFSANLHKFIKEM